VSERNLLLGKKDWLKTETVLLSELVLQEDVQCTVNIIIAVRIKIFRLFES
jgi:hypothetical protein